MVPHKIQYDDTPREPVSQNNSEDALPWNYIRCIEWVGSCRRSLFLTWPVRCVLRQTYQARQLTVESNYREAGITDGKICQLIDLGHKNRFQQLFKHPF